MTSQYIKDGWFREVNDESFPGQAFCLRVKEVLYSERSEFQDVLVFESTDFGNVLALDGIIQCTERDEFAYQEMITHVAMYAHRNPRRVLVIGGGDGGVIREVLKHGTVQEATLVEIDDSVIRLSKKYLPKMAAGLDDQRAKVVITDGFKFLKECSSRSIDDKYDVIITDSSDPEGPAEAFFQKHYFQLLSDALADDGIVISMASENIWLNLDKLAELRTLASEVFPVAKVCNCMIPTYTSGQIALLCCSKGGSDVAVPVRVVPEKEAKSFRYYNSAIHQASFVQPTWAAQRLQ